MYLYSAKKKLQAKTPWIIQEKCNLYCTVLAFVGEHMKCIHEIHVSSTFYCSVFISTDHDFKECERLIFSWSYKLYESVTICVSHGYVALPFCGLQPCVGLADLLVLYLACSRMKICLEVLPRYKFSFSKR